MTTHASGTGIALGMAVVLLTSGCGDGWERPSPYFLWDVTPVIPAPTSPENVIEAIEVIYNDKVRSAGERSAAYADLFDPAFVFHLQPGDIASGLPASWGLEEELAAHEALFSGQEAGAIYSLELRIRHDPARGLTPAELGREGWQEVFATDVYLRVMFTLQDGLEMNGGQGEFLFPPSRGRYWIADWTDLPRPGSTNEAAVEPSTWGRIKHLFQDPGAMTNLRRPR